MIARRSLVVNGLGVALLADLHQAAIDVAGHTDGALVFAHGRQLGIDRLDESAILLLTLLHEDHAGRLVLDPNSRRTADRLVLLGKRFERIDNVRQPSL